MADLYAPPTPKELEEARNASLYAPPTANELEEAKNFLGQSPGQKEEAAKSEIIDKFNKAPHALGLSPQQVAAIRGASQGATLGFSDEAYALLQSFLKGTPYLKEKETQTTQEEAAKSAYPKTYLGSEIGGTVATTLVPGMNVAKAAGTAAKIAIPAATGAIAGLGYSEKPIAKELMTDVPTGLKTAGTEAGIGAATGLATQYIPAALGKAAVEVPKKIASTITGITPEMASKYLSRPKEALQAARPIAEIGKEAYEDLLKLKKSISEGSKKSYEVLENAKGYLYPKDVQDILAVGQGELDKLGTGAVKTGVGSVAKKSYAEVESIVNDIKNMVGEGPGLKYTDAKKALQDIDSLEKIWKSKESEFSERSIAAIRNIRSSIRQKLGERVPEFNQVMEPVAQDTALYKNALKMLGDPQKAGKKIASVAKDPSRTEDAAIINALGKRSGKDYVTEAADKQLMDSFKRDLTRGSKMVNIGALTGKALGMGAGGYAGYKYGGEDWKSAALGGYAGMHMDKYGGALAKKILDVGRTKGWDYFGRFGNVLKNASQQSGVTLPVTTMLLQKNEPDFQKILNNMVNEEEGEKK